MYQRQTVAAKAADWRYVFLLTVTLASIAAVLLALVDFRRGFLLPSYLAVTPYFAFHPAQILLTILGLTGGYLSWRGLSSWEAEHCLSGVDGYLKAFIAVLTVLLVADLFTYRGVAAARAALSGKLSASWLEAFGIQGPLRPVALALSYLATVWHATLLGVLIAGLAATVLARFRPTLMAKKGFAATLMGGLYALPQPFCSCCASAIVPSLASRGASSYFMLAFLVGAPMLNLTTLILAAVLLPSPYAILRIVAGIGMVALVSYAVARLAEKWPLAALPPSSSWLSSISRVVERYFELLQLRRILPQEAALTPSQLVRQWLRTSLWIGIILVPTLFIGSVLTSAVVQVLPSAVGNNWLGVVAAALAGTLLMVSTWTEIPVALQLLQAGLKAPAAVVLVTMPPLSVPCLLVLAGTLGRFREAIIFALTVFVLGLVAGGLFLLAPI